MISTGKEGSGPLYLQIYSQLKQDIACGALAEGTVLTGQQDAGIHAGGQPAILWTMPIVNWWLRGT